MGDYLYTNIEILVPVINSNAQSTYNGFAYGGNLNPRQFGLPPGEHQFTEGAISVPNAVIGAEGTYPLEQTRWDVLPQQSEERSTVMLSGTVTYVTVRTPFEIETTQTIDVTPQVAPRIVSIDALNVHFTDNGTPNLSLDMDVDAGFDNLAAADKRDDQAAVTNKQTISMKRVITRKKETDSGDKAEATRRLSTE